MPRPLEIMHDQIIESIDLDKIREDWEANERTNAAIRDAIVSRYDISNIPGYIYFYERVYRILNNQEPLDYESIYQAAIVDTNE